MMSIGIDSCKSSDGYIMAIVLFHDRVRLLKIALSLNIKYIASADSLSNINDAPIESYISETPSQGADKEMPLHTTWDAALKLQ
eukprot:5454339-Amphidinium_carterae.1